MNIYSEYKGLGRDIYSVAYMRFIVAAGMFVMPMLTFIFIDKLGLNTLNAGVLVAICTSSYIPGSLLGGWLVDKYSDRFTLIASMFGASVFWFLSGILAFELEMVVTIVIAFLFLGMTDPAINSYIANNSREDSVKGAFSLSYLAKNVGLSLGALVSGFLFSKYPKLVFFIEGGALVTSAIIGFCLLGPSKNNEDKSPKEKAGAEGYLSLKTVLVLFTIFILVLCYCQTLFTLPVQLETLYKEESPKLYGIIVSLNAAIVLLFTPLLAKATKNLTSNQILAIASVFLGVGLGAHYFLTTYSLILAFVFVWTIGEILIWSNSPVLINDMVKDSERGRANGMLSSVNALGFVVAPLFGGYFLSMFQNDLIWPALTLLCGCGILIIYALSNWQKSATA
ncbi:MFS transporter [Vibrio sp. TRT 17S01]|uniref:MFS transporter n=1 Tax=Vibrio sp. TRT 17S01 TaxID=3418505 RepID=UPI003CF22823